MFSDCEFEIIEQEERPLESRIEIEKLPYIFVDPLKFDKKIDPKKLQFGSKIDSNETKKKMTI